MSFSGTLTYRQSTGAGNEEMAITNTASLLVAVDESVTTGQTNFQIVVTLDVSAVKQFWLSSDQNVTFETNSGTSPADTISLLANVPYVWHQNSYDTFKLGTDVTSIYITNASGSTASIKMRAIVDSTP